MARKKRIWYPGAIYHLMSRGNRRAAIFIDEADYLHFLQVVKIIRGRHPFKIHSICLMTNHFHMLLETSDIAVWRIMQKILSIYAEDFNHQHSFNGHLFEGRYTSSIVEDERYFLEVSRYIHLNPVKALMVKEPSAFKYSSYGIFVNEESKTKKSRAEKLIGEITDPFRILNAFGQNPRAKYRKFVESRIASHAEEELLIQKEMKEDSMWLPW